MQACSSSHTRTGQAAFSLQAQRRGAQAKGDSPAAAGPAPARGCFSLACAISTLRTRQTGASFAKPNSAFGIRLAWKQKKNTTPRRPSSQEEQPESLVPRVVRGFDSFPPRLLFLLANRDRRILHGGTRLPGSSVLRARKPVGSVRPSFVLANHGPPLLPSPLYFFILVFF